MRSKQEIEKELAGFEADLKEQKRQAELNKQLMLESEEKIYLLQWVLREGEKDEIQGRDT